MNEIIASLQTPPDQPWILDGGLATELERRGHVLDTSLWSGEVLAQDPQEVVDVHRAFIAAGANIITTASYQLAPLAGSHHVLSLLWERSFEAAQSAAAAANQPVAIAGSIGPIGAALGGGQEYSGNYAATDDQLRRFHVDRLRALAASPVDILAVETIPQLREALFLSELLAGQEKPAWLSLVCRDGETLASGEPLSATIRALDMSPGVNAIGVNCVSPDVAQAALATMRQLTEKPLLAYPNSGESFQDGAWCGERHDLGWMVPGLWAVGGCCRVYPEDIAALAKTRNRE